MKNIKVNYRQHWSNDGTHYDQTIKLDKSFIKYINKQIDNYYNSNDENKEIICKTIGFSKYYDCYLQKININEKICFLNLTQLRFIYYYLSINNYIIDRILYRNTMLEII